MTFGISFESVSPLPPERLGATLPGEAAGDFEDLFRVGAATARPNDPPRVEDSPQAADPPTNASGDAAGSASGSMSDPAVGDEATKSEAQAEEEPLQAEDESETAAASAPLASPNSNGGQPTPAKAELATDPAANEAIAAGEKIGSPGGAVPAGPSVPAKPQAAKASGADVEIGKPAAVNKTQADEDEAQARSGEKTVEPRGAGGAEKPRRSDNASPAAGNAAQPQAAPEAAAEALETGAIKSVTERVKSSRQPVQNQLPEAPKDNAILEAGSNQEPAGPQKDAIEDAGKSSSTAPADDKGVRLSSADRVRFVQRVARAVDAARPDGEIRLRLRPPELGSIHLRVRTEDGVLAARVETETRQAQTLLTERLPELRERLAEMNIRMERFDVEWRGGEEGRSSSFAQHNGSGGERDFGLPPRAAARRGETAERPLAEAPRLKLHRGDLDVVV